MKLTKKLLMSELVLRSRYTLGPVPRVTLSHQILAALEKDPDHLAIVDGVTGTRISRGQLADQILAVAGWIKGNIDKGDVVGVSLPNTPHYLLPALGSIHAGGAAALINPIYTHSEAEHALKITKPRVVFTTPISIDTLKSVSSDPQYVVLGADLPGCTSFTEVIKADWLEQGGGLGDFNDTALMPFSSGTTGLPKVISLSHKNCVTYNTMTSHSMFGTLRHGKNMLSLLPLFHMYGFSMALNCLMVGACFTTLPRFQLDTLLQAVQNEKITHLPIVPPIAAALAKHPLVDEYDLSSIEQVLCAAAPLSAQLQVSLSTRLKVPSIRNGYGMSEVVAAAICPPPESSPELMMKNSIGKLMPGVEVRVRDIVSGADLGPGQEGEILIRADTVMKGYLGDPGATAATVDPQGWIHTGDIGRYDEEENFYITDRLKELIKYKGWQIAPAELEDCILSHPDVADVGVVGVPAPEDGEGEVPRAFVVLKPGRSTTDHQIQDIVKEKLASYKQLRGGVRMVEQLPRSLAGKLLRRELKKMV